MRLNLSDSDWSRLADAERILERDPRWEATIMVTPQSHRPQVIARIVFQVGLEKVMEAPDAD